MNMGGLSSRGAIWGWRRRRVARGKGSPLTQYFAAWRQYSSGIMGGSCIRAVVRRAAWALSGRRRFGRLGCSAHD